MLWPAALYGCAFDRYETDVVRDQDTEELLSEEVEGDFYSNSLRMRFNDALEKRYRRIYAHRGRGYGKGLLVILLFGYVAYGVLDWYLLGENVTTVWAIRYFIGAPILALLTVAIRDDRAEPYLQYFIIGAILSLIVTTLMMVQVVDGEVVHLYVSSLLAMIMGGLTITRVYFYYAVFITIVYMVLSSFVLIPLAEKTPLLAYYLLLSFVAVILCLVAVSARERMVRREFVQKILIQRKNNELKKANDKLKVLVDIDPLTKIANRRHFDHVLDEEWRRARRRGFSISMLMVDIDFFKAFNDGLGHLEGDKCIQQVARCMANIVRRPGDLVSRYGGEEFAVVLPSLNVEEAERLAKVVCRAVEALHITHPSSQVSEFVTVSIGVAAIVPTNDFSKRDLVAMADQALYTAKNHGRNKTEVVITPQQESLLDELEGNFT
ncbi:MAG: hypothetical protein COA99_05725 [Moraxellaceae bacterium]|nr:MAG: hypothetical protein COA99_05725 [Moraxellaceae bacterium]